MSRRTDIRTYRHTDKMFDRLNPKQREAVELTSGPLLILAGAGSGKTRVLTHRIAHLISQKQIAADRILAVTFTNKAADEMKGRVWRLLGERGSPRMWVATFHSASLRILRGHAPLLGYKNEFTIYDDTDQVRLIESCLGELGPSFQTLTPRLFASRINQAKNEAVVPAEFESRFGGDFLLEKVATLYPLYQKKLLENQAMDFGDLLLNTLLLFKNHPEVLRFYQQYFSHIHVDEYQDTNRCQYLLLNLLAEGHRNLCVVGDDDQSIYRFRGADIRNILDFQNDYPETKVVRLEQNYRSTGTILKAASGLVSHNRKRLGKTLWTENSEGEKVTLFRGETERDEAQFVVSEISRLRKGLRLDEMAIFYRTHAQSRVLEDEFRKAKIPYAIFGGVEFYGREEVRDILAYLRLLVNPDDSISLKRVINVPRRGIGRMTIDRLERLASHLGQSLWQTLEWVTLGPGLSSPEAASILNRDGLKKLKPFVDLIRDLREKKGTTPLVEFLMHLYEATGYWKMWEEQKTAESQGRLENLEEFVNVVSDYAREAESPTLEGFLDQSSLMSGIDELKTAGEKIPMMTFHLAKGLEFPAVFMVGMEEGLFPHNRSLESEEEVEEERRLCYVGITRAREKLLLSFVSQRSLFGSYQYNDSSRFLSEIPAECLETVSQPGSRQESFHRIDWTEAQGSWDDDNQTTESVSLSPKGTPLGFRRGLRVGHPVFGVGEIRACEPHSEGDKLTIAFSGSGVKKILSKYANLTIL